jgi:hypothetical protein
VLKQTNDVPIIGHCRKKGNGDGVYGDIAVIQYNQKNGATCFYQALGNLPAKVTAPSEGNGPGKFPWFNPKVTADIQCVRCHDNGPFVRSPYLAQLRNEAKNRLPGTNPGNGRWDRRFSWNLTLPYTFVGNDFQSWKVHAVSVTGPGADCASCHRLGLSSIGGRYEVATGTAQVFGLEATAKEQAHKNHPHSGASPIWMQPGQILYDADVEDEAKAVAACANAIAKHANDSSAPPPPAGCQSVQYGQGNTCRGGSVRSVLNTATRSIPGSDAAAAAAAGPPKLAAATPEVRNVLDFSDSENRGISGGRFENFAFNLLSQSERRISVRYGDQRQSNVVATFDYADCTRGQESLLEKPLGGLAAGDPVWVESVDIEMVPHPQPEMKWAGGVCYGYREPGGGWHWNLTTAPLTYDPATKLVRARISVQRGPMDALKIVFDYSVPRQFVQTVTVTTRPITTTPGQ